MDDFHKFALFLVSSLCTGPLQSATGSSQRYRRSKNISKTEELSNNFTLMLNKTDIQHDDSLQNVVDLLQDTLAWYKEISFTEVQHKIITEQKRKKLIYATANAFQTFALRYGRHHLNESKPWIRKSYDKIR
ncbi:uncharacterized protein LOC111319940, partial [Stylophora pistillata]|uniref:uncharacterized protein LOC111319940 n=1 Tax=Stylophora pistillata TaxID=50429 RepID=UPI000C041020